MLAWFKLLKLSVKIKFQIQRDYSYMKMRLLISRTILLLLLHVVSGEDKSDRDTLELVLPLARLFSSQPQTRYPAPWSVAEFFEHHHCSLDSKASYHTNPFTSMGKNIKRYLRHEHLHF